MPPEVDDIAALIDVERGTVAGRAFADDRVYDLELERVFARAWCFLCDTRVLTAPGQFVSTFTGEDPVVVVRQNDGSVKAMLNSCRHRGMRVCGTSGHALQLTCGYHGWTYDLDGRLVGVLDGDEEFRRWAQERHLALIPVTRTIEVAGLLFGTWDATSPEPVGSGPSPLGASIEAVRVGSPLTRHPRPMWFEENWKVVVESLGRLADREEGTCAFPSFAALPSRGLVVAVHPKGPSACEVALSVSARASIDACDLLNAAIDTELQPEGPRTVVLNLKPRGTGPEGCPAEEVPSVRPPKHIDARALTQLYRAWIEHLIDDRPLTGLVT